MTATPSAPPICRVVLFMADPTPAFWRGTALITAAVAGAMTMLRPAASSDICTTMSP